MSLPRMLFRALLRQHSQQNLPRLVHGSSLQCLRSAFQSPPPTAKVEDEIKKGFQVCAPFLYCVHASVLMGMRGSDRGLDQALVGSDGQHDRLSPLICTPYTLSAVNLTAIFSHKLIF